jgi:hypothetical protein
MNSTISELSYFQYPIRKFDVVVPLVQHIGQEVAGKLDNAVVVELVVLELVDLEWAAYYNMVESQVEIQTTQMEKYDNKYFVWRCSAFELDILQEAAKYSALIEDKP